MFLDDMSSLITERLKVSSTIELKYLGVHAEESKVVYSTHESVNPAWG